MFESPQQDLRTHVRLDADTGAAVEGMLFQTVGLELSALPRAEDPSHPAEMRMNVRLRNLGEYKPQIDQLDQWHPLGGERRLVSWRQTEGHDWTCPSAVGEALEDATRVRLQLATPAIFKGGWMPGWLQDDLTGSLDNCDVGLRLVAAEIPRWRPISGWSYESGQVGPKPIRRMVPAGSVYFFEVDSDSQASKLADWWLESVCDDDQACRDGFGLALWGVWDYLP